MTSSKYRKIRNNSKHVPVRCFKCRGEESISNNFDYEGSYCASGELERILQPGIVQECPSYCKVFGITVPVSSAFTSMAENLRCLSVKSFFALQNSAKSWKSSFTSTLGYSEHKTSIPLVQHREDVCILLDFLKLNCRRFLEEDTLSASTIHTLQNYLTNLKSWAVSIGRISDIPEHILDAAVSVHNISTAGHCFFHLKLDFWWFFLATYHILDSPKIWPHVSIDHMICSTNHVQFQNKFVSQTVFVILKDLIVLAYMKFKKLQPVDYLKVSAFHCPCVKEFWVLLLHLLNHRERTNQDESLWMYLHHIIQDIASNNLRNSDSQRNDSDGEERLRISLDEASCAEFCLWIVINVATIWKYDKNGKYIAPQKGLSNYFEVQKQVNIILNMQEGNRSLDNQLLYCLRACLNLNTLWEPNVDLLISFTDFFLKNLNTCNQYSKMGIEAHCLPKNSGLEWIQQTKELVSRRHVWSYNDSAFHLFLMLTCSQLHNVQPDKLVSSWRKVAGRTFLKLTRPRVNELTESGLHNMLSLLLALSCVSNTKDISNKLIVLAGMVTGNVTKSLLVWKALFASAHHCLHNREDIATSTKALADLFMTTVRNFIRPEQDHSSRTSYQKLVVLYLNEVQNIFDCSPNLALSEHLLIGESFGLLLPHCGVSELSLALFTIQQAILQLRSIRERMIEKSVDYCHDMNVEDNERHKAFVAQLFHHVLPFVESHSLTQTPPDSIATIAAGLTLLVSDRFCLLKEQDMLALMNKFGISVDVNSNISCIFLCHTIPETRIVSQLDTVQQIQILGVWLRNCVSISARNQQVEQLGRLVSKLPEISRIFPDLLNSTQQDLHHTSMVVLFFRSLSDRWKQLNSVHDKSALQNHFQESLMAFKVEVKNVTKTNTCQEVANHVSKLTGNLVFYCSAMIYSVGAPTNLLPAILDTTVLPVSLRKDSSLTPVALNACKEHLHLFFAGLVQLNFKTDPYIARKLKDLLTNYLPKFPIVSGKSHPLLSFQHYCQLPVDKMDDILLFITETISERFLSRKETNPHLPLALNFLNDLFRHSSNRNRVRIAVIIFPLVLEHSLVPVQEKATALNVQLLLSSMLSLYDQNQELRSALAEKLIKFVEGHLAWQSRQVFSLLKSLTIINRKIVSDNLGSITRAVELVEEKRGGGLDKSLREGWRNVITKL